MKIKKYVVLKSGGPLMKFKRIINDMAYCSWIGYEGPTGYKFFEEIFFIACLDEIIIYK